MTIVYGKPGCHQCKFTVEKLSAQGAPFEYKDVTQDPEALAAVHALNYQSLPVVVTATGEHWSGLRPDRLAVL